MRKINPPKKIKVGGFYYTLVFQPESFFTVGGAYGSCCTKTRTLNVWEGALDCDKGDIIVHELIHALNDLVDIDDDSKEEDIARRTGSAFWGLMVDNPRLFKYLLYLAAKN